MPVNDAKVRVDDSESGDSRVHAPASNALTGIINQPGARMSGTLWRLLWVCALVSSGCARDGCSEPSESPASVQAPAGEQSQEDSEPPVAGTDAKGATNLPGLDALCEEACARALDLSMKGFPLNTRPEVREQVETRLKKECPQACQDTGSDVAANCMIRAETLQDLGACPIR